MSDKVLYQKWRPSVFSEIIGQNHVVVTLKNAVELSKTSHAYLFCGPRGVGKTTTARVMAKALNCPSSPNCCMQEPSKKTFCETCESINQGTMIDLIEIDAASNRSIDDIRDIKEKALYAPNMGKVKVYIIDEAHGLTGPAQQAFLKLLEEPPPNVVIILATTAADSLPLTIISRCQRFDFKRINVKEISAHIKFIAKSEEISIEKEALDLIAQNCSGSLRDAENLLQQIATMNKNKITGHSLVKFLGLTTFAASIEILAKILEKDSTKALILLNEQIVNGADPSMIKNQLLTNARGLIFSKNGLSSLLQETEHAIKKLEEIGSNYDLKTINGVASILLKTKVTSNEYPPIGLELAIVEACSVEEKSNDGGGVAVTKSYPTLQKNDKEISTSTPRNAIQDAKVIPEPKKSSATSITNVNRQDEGADLWKQVCSELRRKKGVKYWLGGLLSSASPQVKEQQVILTFKSNTMRQNFLDEISNGKIREVVQSAVSDKYNKDLKIIVADSVNTEQKDSSPLYKTPIVQHAISMGAKVKETKE
ncbi:MAG: DNA polymerase III subunit gamma/tau [Chloroflexota bacterium]